MAVNNQLHESRVAALREAFEAGLSLRAAAAHCGVHKNTVERYWRKWKSQDFGGEMMCRVKGSTKKTWHAEASQRNMSVQELHAFVVEIIAEEKLFSALMDG